MSQMSQSVLQPTLDRRSFVSAATAAVATAAVAGVSIASAAESSTTDIADVTAVDEATEEAQTAGGSYDVVVIGMGGAGMCAAIAAKEAGAEKVCILEKSSMEGGNTSFASSGMNASETKYQKEQGIEDTNDLFISDTLTGGHNMNNVALVTYMCDHSSDGIDWLGEHGIELSNLVTSGGASVARTHRPADKSAVGQFMVPLLSQAVTDAGIDVYYETGASELVLDEDGKVSGVKAADADGNEVDFEAGAVVLATGGFGHNFQMIEMYRPDLKDYVTTNRETAQGDGVVMAQAAGANLINMDQIQAHPTVYQETGMLVGEGVRGSGAILINKEGNRFINDMGTRDVVSNAELQQPDGVVYEFFDQSVYDNTPVTHNYENLGMTIKGETLEDLCSQIDVPVDALQATLDAWNKVVNGEAEDEFGRTTGLVAPLETAPYYVIPVNPGIHHTMGGVYVDTDSQALTIKGEKVAGLYAAGEVTGGVHGANRLGGNAVCDIVVMGINAGTKAAESLA